MNGLNLYAYCINNPIMYKDPNGNFHIPTSEEIFNYFFSREIKKIENAINWICEKVTKPIYDAFDWTKQAGIDAFNWTTNTAIRFGNWMSNNWKTVLDWTFAGIGAATVVLGAVGLFVTLPFWLAAVGVAAAAAATVWGIGRLAKWW